ncbi:MAG: Ig-like domain-containing protein, partial [Woeseiaceae bacterium]|nr:Ig-like domain-containing protein [Woeseiaceae bacterium]
DNGVSAKSKVVSATLDGVRPTLSSHSPTANQTSVSGKAISLTFSEPVTITCPDGTSTEACGNAASSIGAVRITRSSGADLNLSGFGQFPNYTTSINGQHATTGWNNNETITVTVKKEWFLDAGGNQMAADYTFSFTSD